MRKIERLLIELFNVLITLLSSILNKKNVIFIFIIFNLLYLHNAYINIHTLHTLNFMGKKRN